MSNKAFSSPQELYDYFKQYKCAVKKNPVLVHDFVGKDGFSAHRERERPLTMEGFECFLMDLGVVETLQQYLENRQGRYDDFVSICSRIRMEIRRDQIEGGMSGIYNPSITQRLNGLVDKSEQKVIQEQPMFDDSED